MYINYNIIKVPQPDVINVIYMRTKKGSNLGFSICNQKVAPATLNPDKHNMLICKKNTPMKEYKGKIHEIYIIQTHFT